VANAGFRGTTVHVSEIDIRGRGTGASLKYRILFVDPEGQTHATCTHDVSISDDSPLQEPVRNLLAAIQQHAENIHFETPSIPTARQVSPRGIAEAVSGITDPSDEPGESG